MAPISFIHLTDLHIANPDGNEPHLFSDTSKTLGEVLAMIGTINPKPSFIIVSGDVANNEDAAAYRELKKVWGTLDIPTFFALGNHDSREGFQSVMLGKTEHLDAPYFHAAVVDGIHIVTLDSKTPKSPHGSIEAEQFDWLEETLDEHADLPKLVVLHHPPILGFESPDLAFETLAPEDSERFLSLLKGRNIVAVLCGHVHQQRISVWNGIPVVIGMGHHSMLDVLHGDGIRGLSGAGFSLCRVMPTGLTVNFIPLPSDGREVMRMSRADLMGYAEKLRNAS